MVKALLKRCSMKRILTALFFTITSVNVMAQDQSIFTVGEKAEKTS